jgi:hypothetical protein
VQWLCALGCHYCCICELSSIRTHRKAARAATHPFCRCRLQDTVPSDHPCGHVVALQCHPLPGGRSCCTTAAPGNAHNIQGSSRAVPVGGARVRPHRAPKNRGPPSHRTVAFFPIKPIYYRHKYVKSDALLSYRLVLLIFLNCLNYLSNTPSVSK